MCVWRWIKFLNPKWRYAGSYFAYCRVSCLASGQFTTFSYFAIRSLAYHSPLYDSLPGVFPEKKSTTYVDIERSYDTKLWYLHAHVHRLNGFSKWRREEIESENDKCDANAFMHVTLARILHESTNATQLHIDTFLYTCVHAFIYICVCVPEWDVQAGPLFLGPAQSLSWKGRRSWRDRRCWLSIGRVKYFRWCFGYALCEYIDFEHKNTFLFAFLLICIHAYTHTYMHIHELIRTYNPIPTCSAPTTV